MINPVDRHKLSKTNESCVNKHKQTCADNSNVKPQNSAKQTNVDRVCAKPKPEANKNSSEPEDKLPFIAANFTTNLTKNTVRVTVNENVTMALVDSGAAVSCLGDSFFQKIFPNGKHLLNPCQIQKVVGIGNTQHTVLGVVELDVNFGGLTASYPFYVIQNLHHSLILGHDCMVSNNVTLNWAIRQMFIQGNLKICHLTTNTGFARSVKSTLIPANSEANVNVKVARLSKDRQVLLEPVKTLSNQNLSGAKCLVTVRKGKAVIRLLNPTNQDIEIKGNKVLAAVSEIDKNSIYALNTAPNSENSDDSPEDKPKSSKFEFNLDDSDIDDAQKQRLLNLLDSNSDLFAEGLHDLGRTHLQHVSV